MTKHIGPTFFAELQSAGLAGLPFAWQADGTVTYGAAITADQRAGIETVLAAHDPARPDAAAVEAECQRRILADFSESAQRNLALAQPGLSTDDKALVADIAAWLTATLAACRALVASAAPDYADDHHWPAWTPAWSALVERF